LEIVSIVCDFAAGGEHARSHPAKAFDERFGHRQAFGPALQLDAQLPAQRRFDGGDLQRVGRPRALGLPKLFGGQFGRQFPGISTNSIDNKTKNVSTCKLFPHCN
jgi:hypothetical protein